MKEAFKIKYPDGFADIKVFQEGIVYYASRECIDVYREKGILDEAEKEPKKEKVKGK